MHITYLAVFEIFVLGVALFYVDMVDVLNKSDLSDSITQRIFAASLTFATYTFILFVVVRLVVFWLIVDVGFGVVVYEPELYSSFGSVVLLFIHEVWCVTFPAKVEEEHKE